MILERLKRIGVFVAVAVIIAGLGGGSLILAYYQQSGKTFPRTWLGATVLGGLSESAVREKLVEFQEQFTVKPLYVQWQGKGMPLTPPDLGLSINIESTLKHVPFVYDHDNFSFFLTSLQGKNVEPVISIDQDFFEAAISGFFPHVPRMRNAAFQKNDGGEIVLSAEQGGWQVDYGRFQKALVQSMFNGSAIVLDQVSEYEQPTIMAQELEAARPALIAGLSKTRTLAAPENAPTASRSKSYTFAPIDYLNFIHFQKNPEAGGSEAGASETGAMQWNIEPFPLEKMIEEQLAPDLEVAPEPVRIYKEGEKILFEGKGSAGYRIMRPELISAIEIPLQKLEPEIVVDPQLQALGIKEQIAVGYTTFYGSPANRVHNIGVGISRYNGLLVAPDEVFSFNAHLGRVDGTTGFKKELVIKNEGTIPEYGGGLCQVSTTLYRAAVFAGLPIVERFPHSYAVTYYSQVDGHGLDGTIYPPDKDVKFLNNTGRHVLIQAYREGYEAFYKFYGTSDGRKVAMDGPYISNRKAAPSEEVIFYVNDLPPGQRAQVQKPQAGFDVVWYRTITKPDGIEEKETIFTRYKTVPPKYQVGAEITPAGENAGLVE